MSLKPSKDAPANTEAVTVRLTENKDEIKAAQRLRYEVFYEEYGAKPSAEMAEARLDIDDFDDYADHLIVIDKANGSEKIVGTYRLLRQEPAEKYGRFYSSSEFDLTKLLSKKSSVLELGRSCVLQEYRTRPILNMLWKGIAEYVSDHQIDVLFGCASLEGTNTDNLSEQLSYLHHFHLSPDSFCPRALDEFYINMDIIPKEELNPRRAFASLPPLIKGYLRVGATIGDGAYIDKQFNTTDICIVVHTSQLAQRYRKHYERKNQKAIPDSTRENAELLHSSSGKSA